MCNDQHSGQESAGSALAWKGEASMKQQACNPYPPSWEYIPDAEPYVFNGRVYIYGSHERFRDHAYCLNLFPGGIEIW